MRHFRSLEDVYLKDSWVTIGSFDGVHLGHQEIVRRVTSGAHAEGGPAVVITFFPHPAVVLRKQEQPIYLTTPEERAALLGDLGVDVVVTHPFNLQVAALSAHEFMDRLHAHLDLRHLCVGYDFALGHGREGNIARLRELGEEYDYQVHAMPAVTNGGEVVSSSRIRAALAEGEVAQAARLLGRPYRVGGKVVPGDARGRAIGVPTANLEVWASRALPREGVYICRVRLGEEVWGAVTNVGVRPTFEREPVPPRVEAHLLDFDRDLYGQEIQLDFLARLRDERRFPDIQALVAQIQEDIRQAREFFSARPD